MEFKAYINGEFVKGKNKLAILSPKNNKEVGTVASLEEQQINFAFDSANKAFQLWRGVSTKERIDAVNRFKKLMLKNKEELAKIMNLEIAKSVSDSIVEIERTAQYIDDTIKSWEEIQVQRINIDKKENDIHRLPLGVVLAISPFNYPVNLALSKLAPALISGNTVVFKPATNGSLSGSFLAKLFDKANFPKGVFNLVTGRGRDIGDALTANKHIKMISFTGSVRVGKDIAEAQSMIPLVLELGGNDAGYIRKDADLDLAAAQVAKGAFSYFGQRCTAIKRVIVDKSIKKEFLSKLLPIVEKMEIGPLVTTGAADWVMQLKDDAVANGSKVILGGERKGNEIQNTIVVESKPSKAWFEEAFGPLLPIVEVVSDEEALELFNNTNFGLQNSIFTKDDEWAKEFALKIESGSVNINASSSRGPDIFPFLGVKDSGFGVQGIEQALISMTRIHNVVNNK